MKHGKPKKVPLTDIQRLAHRVENYHLPTGSFDYAARAQSLNDTQKFFYGIVREARVYHADLEAEAVIEAARRLWHTSMDAAYPDDFWEDYQKLKSGDAAGLESAIRFLEADPYFFRSGYVKVSLIRGIKSFMLKSSDIQRLQNVVLALVDRRDDRDFRAFCKLACNVDGPELRTQLTQRVDQGDFDVRRRARWVLEALAQKDTMKERKRP